MKKIMLKSAAVMASASVFMGAMPVLGAETPDFATREYVVSEFVQSVGRSNLTGSGYILSKFDDADEISEEYVSDFEKAVTSGLVEGYDDNTLHPKDYITRVEALAILARCIPETEDADGEPIEFTDVPGWAEETINGLSKLGIVEGYGDGRLGAEDNITVEQVKLLTDRSDEILNTVTPGESFYGYINNKAFRNYEKGAEYTVDALHGIVIPTENSWSTLDDIELEILDQEDQMLRSLVNGELEYENGSPEQRIYDMLKCIDKLDEKNESDTELYNSYRQKIADAKNINEFLAAVNDIFAETGLNLAFDVMADLEPTEHHVDPYVDVLSAGLGGLINYSSVSKKLLGSKYRELMKECLKYSGVEFSDSDIEKAIGIQEKTATGTDYMFLYQFGLIIRPAYDPDYTEEQLNEDIEKLQAEHPEEDEEEDEEASQETVVYTVDEADKLIKNVKISDMLSYVGFDGFDHIIMPATGNIEASSDIFTDENLNALKANALLYLAQQLLIFGSDEEQAAYEDMDTLSLATMLQMDFDTLNKVLSEEDDIVSDDTAASDEELSYEDKLLSDENLAQLGSLLPMDVGLMYCKYYYDDEISEVLAKMVKDFWDAYINRFENNTWMSDETKQNAIKKIKNMVAVVGYPDNYDYPEIISVEDGGTFFRNMLNILKNNLATTIRECNDQEFLRTEMFMAPDTVNACYYPMFNTMNIFAGILKAPIYDPEASYASNLGAIGAVIGHEIGHAFDADGSKYDENGCLNNWWTDEDTAIYEEKKQLFIDYYKNFEVMDGVVQDSSLTITENMADFAGIQCVFDIIGDDEEAQREALESWASLWAQIGSSSVITSDSRLHNVHSSNQVRVNAIVASLDCFYELYDISEDDPMYVAPENRLNLW